MRPLRTALIGYGLAGRVIHRPLLQVVPELELSHVVTADPGRQAQAAADLPGAQVVQTAAELWARADELDVVVIATPNDVHTSLARTALDLDKAVVVDKPMALEVADAAALVQHAADRGVPLSVFHNRRWDSDTLTAQALLASGRLGDVHRLEARFTRFRPQVRDRWREQPGGGGVLLDLGTHLVDQARLLLGPVTSVYAEVRARRAGATVDDDVLLVLSHVSGASSLLECSAAAPWTGPRLVLQGSAAGWVKDDLDRQEEAQRAGAAPLPEPPGTVWDESGGSPLTSVPGDWPAFYRSFAAAVHGQGPVPVDPADAVAVLRVLAAAQVSSDSRSVVELG